MSDNVNNDLFIIAKTGHSLSSFMSSDVGKFFIKKADDLEREAELEFRSVDPMRHEEVRAVQNKMLVADMFRKFLISGIEEGKLAEDSLDHMNEVYE